MKKLVFIFAFVLIFTNAFSQTTPTILISQQGIVNGCSADFFDSGGGSGSYGPNENFTITFHSNNTPNTHIKMTFNSFDVDPGDTLIVYDGSSTAATLIGKYNNNHLPPNFVDASIYGNGDLTFKFKSNGALQNAGWFCSLICEPACQKIIAAFDTLATVPPPNDSNYVDICIGNTIRFAALGSGPGVFPQNNALYSQDSNNSIFIWNFGDGVVDTGMILYHTYTVVRGYDISLTVIDSLGCANQNYLGGRVRISKNPISAVHPMPDICSSSDTAYITLGYTLNSVVEIAPISAHQSSSQRYDSTTFIPDGPNCPPGSYNTLVTFTQFLPGQTITSSNDILSVCVDMEHSYSGDLGFVLICPNGQSITLSGNDHNGFMWLGIPNENDGTATCDPAQNPPGTGWVYGWSQIYSQQGYLNVLDNVGSGTSLTPADTINHTNYYTPDQSFSGLIGCPLNGTWNIQITDNWGSDNGYVFWWELNLDPALLPGGWSYQVPIDTVIWSGSFLHVINDTTVMVIPSDSGNFQYTVTVKDAFGCSYDTTLYIQVVQTPHPDFGHDTTLCSNGGVVYNLDAGPGASWNWSTGNTSQTQPVSATGIFSVDVENHNVSNTLTCKGSDTILVTVRNRPATVNLGPDICSLTPVQLDAGNTSGFHFHWSTSNPADTTHLITASISGLYAVTVAEDLGFNCRETDSIFVRVNPEPVIELGADTTMCSYAKMHMHVSDINGYLDNPLYNYTYAWSPFGQSTRDIDITCLNSDQTYPFKVVVTGCTSVEKTRTVNSLNCALELPNVITPNGDLKNDVMKITGIENFPGSKLQVYDRWGKKIFESDDYNNSDHAWDGGNAADGVYYYVLTINYGKAGDCVGTKSINGTVTIMR